MKQYVQIFEEIKNSSSRKEKENLLKKYENVPGFKEILKFVYDPMITTGLAKKKIEKKLNGSPTRELNNIFEAMNYVRDNNTGKDEIICTVQHFLNKLETEEERNLAKSILIKDLPIGISKVTLNKVYGEDFIRDYAVQKAVNYKDHKDELVGDFAITLKIDGIRATIFNYENGPKIYSKTGKEMDGFIEIEAAFKQLPKGIVYDGELLAENKDNLHSKDLFRLTQKIVRTKGIKTGINFILFDMVPIEEFNKGKSKLPYKDRMDQMDKLYSTYIKGKGLPIKRVPTFYIGNDKNMIDELLEKVVNQGYEGLMINTLDGYYQTKRTKDLMKVKLFKTIDLRCIGVKEDIRGGKCGSLTVDYKGYKVDVGGLKEKEKIMFWKNPELVVGKIIEVKYFEETTNENGGLSLRYPSFQRIRDDKDEVSYE
jgi:DNA ligase-1